MKPSLKRKRPLARGKRPKSREETPKEGNGATISRRTALQQYALAAHKMQDLGSQCVMRPTHAWQVVRQRHEPGRGLTRGSHARE
jgi:hypothetical protein